MDQLRKLNPSFKKDIIPYNLDGYWIKLPKNKGKQFALLKDSVYNALPRPSEFSPVAIQQATVDSVKAAVQTDVKNNPDKEPLPEKKFDKKRISYTVKHGDLLSDIADWFDVTPPEIRSWNKLKTPKLVSGKKLIIWVKANKTGYYKRINAMSAKQKKKLKNKD
jgi:membrane-bound lytic murein transglycosylase D